MKNSIGKIIAELRKENGMTQEELADKLGVSPQAVSKWENNISCPDILLLPVIAELFKVSVDYLLSVQPQETVFIEPEQVKNLDDFFMRVIIENKNDTVKITIPMKLVKLAVEVGMGIPQFSGNNALESIDLEKILLMFESGVMGKLLEVETGNDTISIIVEKR